MTGLIMPKRAKSESCIQSVFKTYGRRCKQSVVCSVQS